MVESFIISIVKTVEAAEQGGFLMNFDQILSAYKTTACILSVETYGDGRYGNIRIAAGNKPHCDEMLRVMGRPFIPDSPYEQYLPQNSNFEDFCYRSAILGQPMHSYVPLPQMGLWLNMFLLPLQSDREGVGYCVYIYNVTPEADSGQRADVSAETSAAVLTTCIKLRASDSTREALQEVVEDIRQICDSDHCCILLTNSAERTCTSIGEAIRPGSGLPTIDRMAENGFFDVAETWEGTIGDSTCVIIQNPQDMEHLKEINPVWHRSLTAVGVRSVVLFPLKYNGKTLGYMWVNNFNEENTVKIKETLELTTFFLAAEIANYQLLQRLEVMSSMDMLTGVRNRNSMNAAVDDIRNRRVTLQTPCAVIFCDLNGLKRVNDVDGHSAGDRVLKKAAAILNEVFPDNEVYRAGGDEFMIIAEGMDEEAAAAKQKQIHDLAAAVEGLAFSTGVHVIRGTEDIRAAMRAADEEMYADKKAYYERHPDRRSR